MTLPAEWPVVEVRVGPYFGTDGKPLEGERVTFEPRAKRLLLEDETTIVRRITSVTLDAEGRGVVELPVSDDPDLSATGWTWQVREKFRWGQTFDIDVLTADVAAGIDLAEVAPVVPNEPRSPFALAAQVNGLEEHGNVVGAVTFSGPTASHRFDATGPTTITLDDYAEGQVATLICFSGADDVTVNDAGDVTLVDGCAWTAELARGAWVSGGGGGEPAVPDTTPPPAITDLTAAGGENLVTGSWSPVTDAESTVKYRWRVWLTSGGAGSTPWTTTTVNSFTKTGLTPGAYTIEVYSFSAGGSTTPDTATATASAPVESWADALAADPADWWWPLDDPSGTTSPREIGSAGATPGYTSLTGVTFGGATLGGSGTAAVFDGTGSGLVTNQGYGTAQTELTIEFLYQRQSGSTGGLIESGFCDAYDAFNAFSMDWHGLGNGAVSFASGVAPTPEFHVVMRLRNDGVGNPVCELFKNGVMVDSADLPRADVVSLQNFRMGYDNSWTTALNGRMSDVRVYLNYALPDDRIMAHAIAAGKA